jgi:hypothetical protein
MMENQNALVVRGLEFQLTHDLVYDKRRGDDDPNQAVTELFPTPLPTTAITIPELRLGTGDAVRALDLTDLQTAIDTSTDQSVVELTDEGGNQLWYHSGEDRETPQYTWGESCDLGRASIRTWLFVHRSAVNNYRLIVATELFRPTRLTRSSASRHQTSASAQVAKTLCG